MRNCWAVDVSRRRLVAALYCASFAIASVLSGCTVERDGGEFGVGACTDRTDNDDDQAIDCDDPDCQAESVCGRAAPLREPEHPADAMPSSSPPAVMPKPRPDAATTSDPPPAQMGDAGSVDATPDATAADPEPPDAAVKQCPVCAADESCIEGYCVPNEAVFVELWDITHISAVYPRVVDTPSGLMCMDVDGLTGEPSEEFPFCPCPADPLVRILVTRPGEKAQAVVETPFDVALVNVDRAEWDVTEQIKLRPEYEITLRAIDRDSGIDPDDLVFECKMAADPEVLGSGKLTCEHEFTGVASKPFLASITVSIQAANMPAAP